MTTDSTHVTVPDFSVQNFAPGWGAAVMGTGVISSLFSALAKFGWAPSINQIFAQIFLIVAIVFAVPIVGITTWRWIKYPQAVATDLKNPVRGAMFATYAGAFLVLAVGFGRAGVGLFGLGAATVLTYVFTVIGAVLALIIGWLFLTDIFARGDVKIPLISGAWFIPPVVTIVVPTALGPLMREPSGWANELLWISWAFLGVGTLLYLIVAGALFFRSATNPAPPAPLAPTLVIGMGPAGLIALDLLLLAEAGERIGVTPESFFPVAAVGAAALWGFGLWWGIAAFVVIRRAHPNLKYALSWWGFTFPLGAWVVSGVTLGFSVDAQFVLWISLATAVLLLLIWLVVVVKTARAISDGTIWAH